MAKATKPAGGKADPNPFGLRNGQRIFVAAYLGNGGNGTRAYLAAHPGVKLSTARAEAVRVLAEPSVRDAIEAGRADMLKRHEMAGDEAIALLALRARADLAEALDEEGKLLPLAQLPTAIRLCVKEVRRDAKGRRVLVLHDALKATELMARATGRLKDAVDLTHRFDHAKYLAGLDEPPKE